MGMKKLVKTIKMENGIFEIIATNPLKEFTVPGVKDELLTVYGIDVINASVRSVAKRLEKMNLVSQISSTTRVIHYSVVSGTKISDLINQKIGFPKVRKVKVAKDIVEVVAEEYDPLDFVNEENYDRIVGRLENYKIEPTNEMVFVILAMMGHCIYRTTTTFISADIFRMVKFIPQMKILAVLETLSNKKCVAKPEQSGDGVAYRVNVKPVDFGLNIITGVLYPLEKVVEEVKEVKEVESPAEKIAGVSLTNEQIGAGVIDWIKQAETEREELISKVEALKKENAILVSGNLKFLDDNTRMEEELHKIKNEFVLLSSNHDKLVKSAAGTNSKITLRSMSGDHKKRVGL